APFARPGRRQRTDQQQETDEAGEDRQDPNATYNTGITHFNANPIVTFVGGAGPYRHDTRNIEAATLRNPPCITASGVTQRLQDVSRGRHVRELAWIGRADICERREFAVRRAP